MTHAPQDNAAILPSPPPPPLPPPPAPAALPAAVAPPRKGAEFFRNAAKASWAIPLILTFGSVVVRNAGHQAATVFDVLRILGSVVAFLAAVVALVGLRRFGRKGILVPALIGLLLNGLLLTIATTNFISAFNRARANRLATPATRSLPGA